MSEASEVHGYGATLQHTVDVPQRDAALAPREKATLKQLFDWERAKADITALLPKGVTYEEVYIETAHAVADNPKLLECTPMSLIRAVSRAARTGLVIGQTVHLVPFKKRGSSKYVCQAITDYKGEIEQAVRSGSAKNINAFEVYEAELEGKHKGKFSLEYGTEPRVVHHPVYDPRLRGPMVGAYAVAEINAWSRKPCWMHISEIDAIRKEYSIQWRDGVCPPWYAKKTVIHRLAKEIAKSPKVLEVYRQYEAEEIPDESEFGDPIAVVEQPAA